MVSSVLTVIDLFSGAGGLSLGFQAAGCLIRAAVDIDKVAGETFRVNFSRLQPDHPPDVLTGRDGDLERLTLDRISGDRPPDILIGGPPCQAFSRLGRGKLDSLSDDGFVGDPRNQLYQRFLEAVGCWRPRAIVMENVPGMLSVGGTNYAAIVTMELAQLGYRVGYALLNAVWYGVPQYRERLFFIGIREELGVVPEAPRTTHQTELPEGYLSPLRERTMRLPFGDEWERIEGELPVLAGTRQHAAVTVSEAIDDLPVLKDHLDGSSLPRGDFRRPIAYRCAPHSLFARQMREWPGLPGADSVDDHATRRTKRDYELFRRMKPGDRYPDALRLAHEREVKLFEDELLRLRRLGQAPSHGSDVWKNLRARYVPPYDPAKFLDKWRKLILGQPSWTVPAHLGRDSYSHIHHDSDQARMITPREAARLQSFPDAFRFSGNMGDCFRQIGNAVPPLLAKAIAQQVLLSLRVHAAVLPNSGRGAIPPS
jgi:DNA (cytosine-5)-methyltransferase 1